MNLPPEIWKDVFDHIANNKDRKQVSLVCRDFESLIRGDIFRRVYVSPRKRDIEVFLAVAGHPLHHASIKEVVWDNYVLDVTRNRRPMRPVFEPINAVLEEQCVELFHPSELLHPSAKVRDMKDFQILIEQTRPLHNVQSIILPSLRAIRHSEGLQPPTFQRLSDLAEGHPHTTFLREEFYGKYPLRSDLGYLDRQMQSITMLLRPRLPSLRSLDCYSSFDFGAWSRLVHPGHLDTWFSETKLLARPAIYSGLNDIKLTFNDSSLQTVEPSWIPNISELDVLRLAVNLEHLSIRSMQYSHFEADSWIRCRLLSDWLYMDFALAGITWPRLRSLTLIQMRCSSKSFLQDFLQRHKSTLTHIKLEELALEPEKSVRYVTFEGSAEELCRVLEVPLSAVPTEMTAKYPPGFVPCPQCRSEELESCFRSR